MRHVTLGLVALAAVAVALSGCPSRGTEKAGEERVNPVDGAVMVWVPGTAEACPNGKFRMGSRPEEIDGLWAANGWEADWKKGTQDEQPAHGVRITRAFYIGRYEVTFDEYHSASGGNAYSRDGCDFIGGCAHALPVNRAVLIK